MRMIDEGIRSLLNIVANALPVASGHGLCIHNLSFFFEKVAGALSCHLRVEDNLSLKFEFSRNINQTNKQTVFA